jgi:cytoskeleton protein RodZ
MKKVGQLLKAEREKRNLSLHEIGMSLKINPKTLSAIEDGDLSQLPAKTFLRGFVRSYAQFLKLDVEQVIKLFHEEMGTTHPESPKPPPTAVIESEINQIKENPAGTTESPQLEKSKPIEQSPFVRPHRANRTALVVVSMVLVVMIVIVARLVEKYQKERRVPEVAKQSEGETSTSLQSNDSTPTTVDESVAVVAASSTSTSTSTTSTTTTLPKPTTTLKPTTTTLRPTTTVPRPTTTLPKPTTTIPKPTTTIAVKSKPTTTIPAATASATSNVATTPAGKPVEVIVEALSDVTINYSLGNDEMKTISLSTGQIHTLKSRSRVTLEVSDGAGASIIVNGRERGKAGPAGKPAKLTYP